MEKSSCHTEGGQDAWGGSKIIEPCLNQAMIFAILLFAQVCLRQRSECQSAT